MRRYIHRARSTVFSVADSLYLAEARALGVELDGAVRFEGRPNIQRLSGRIRLGEGVVLRSRDFQYHSRIFPVRLLTDSPGALIDIGPRTRVNGAALHAQSQILIGSDCLLAAGTTVLDCDGHVLEHELRAQNGRDVAEPVRIGNHVWLGMNVTVLKGTTIGDGVVVGAGSIVASDLPPHTLCAGMPARVIRSLTAADALKGNAG